jgi:ABC-type nickel/cobalt efflux system permease component RcnA
VLVALVTGLLAGALHVWSGPDHLAAIAPLALQQQKRPWLVGIRWGIGHSTGVALVGALSLVLREILPVERLSEWGERLVGVMLIGIGLWGIRRARRIQVHLHQHTHDGSAHAHAHVHAARMPHEQTGAHVHSHAAVGIGVLHGLAGSSHFLGVLPALALPTMAAAAGYIGAFAVGTIMSMGVFAGMMGALATRPAFHGQAAYRALLLMCSGAAIVVGIVWLVMAARHA